MELGQVVLVVANGVFLLTLEPVALDCLEGGSVTMSSSLFKCMIDWG